ncbi:hypothetical protein MRX96_036859 [Rhipicephalus microplus]
MAGGSRVRRWNGCAHVPQHGPDSVHSWLVAGACALACFFAMAGRRSAGFLFVAILDTFQVNRSDGSWPIMLMGGLVYLAGKCIAQMVVHAYCLIKASIAIRSSLIEKGRSRSEEVSSVITARG